MCKPTKLDLDQETIRIMTSSTVWDALTGPAGERLSSSQAELIDHVNKLKGMEHHDIR